MGTTLPSREEGSRWVLAAKGRCVDGRHVDGEIGMRQKQLDFTGACWPLPASEANQCRAGPTFRRAPDQGLHRIDRACPKHPVPGESFPFQRPPCLTRWRQLCSSQVLPAAPVRFVSSCVLAVRVKPAGQAPPGPSPTGVPPHLETSFARWIVEMAMIATRALVMLQHLSCNQVT